MAVRKGKPPKLPEAERENEEKKDDGEMSLEKILNNELCGMNAQIEDLKAQAKALDETVKSVTDIVYEPVKIDESTKKPIKPAEFEKPREFREKLDGLHGYLGQALDYVVRLEKQRSTVFQDADQSELPSDREQQRLSQSQSPVQMTFHTGPAAPNNEVEQKPQRIGVFAWDLERRKMKIQENQLAAEQGQAQPVVATTKILDVVEFGRQLQPAFNKIKEWFVGTLAELRFFPDAHIYYVRHEELATYFGETVGALVTFVTARFEYRRSLLEGRKLGLVRAMAKIAEAQSLAPQVQVGGTFANKGFKLGKEGFGERT
jgi:hypothetical protein